MRIDFHAHQFPSEFASKFREYYGERAGFQPPAWSHEERLREMDEAAVDIELLSCPLAYSYVDEHSPKLCRLLNDALAESCRKSPERFKAFAHLPFNDMDAALEEMSRAIDDLGFIGVMINSNVGGRYLNTPEFLPFWEEAARRRVPVFMHPTEPPNNPDDEMPVLIAFEFDTSLSATKLLYAGIYERFPELVLVLGHMGGAMPYLARRIDIGYDVPSFPEKYKQILRPPSEYAS
ncbi:MAG TPA: amidohydrolase family protein, partial [Dehalococcoidia bacterium]|nr:amidohydrolase family protein [Dehalococcoidia bacterium]